mmetsp:Transcript_38392/g.95267  ORF Transcript_38392/g.95267 Transcript_38392/m.95267 type:complete len:208 (-) Transcript_38392:197-820(-)
MLDSQLFSRPLVGVMYAPALSCSLMRMLASASAPPARLRNTSTALPRMRKELSSAPIFMSSTSSPSLWICSSLYSSMSFSSGAGGTSSAMSHTASGWSSPLAHAANPLPKIFSLLSSVARTPCVFSNSASLYWAMNASYPGSEKKRSAYTPLPGARKSTRRSLALDTRRHASEMANDTSPTSRIHAGVSSSAPSFMISGTTAVVSTT